MRKLDLTSRSRKFLETLPPKQFRQIVTKIFNLMDNPEPPDSKQLAGFPYRRADIGEYRIIYRVEESTLKIALVGKRNDAEVYRDLERLQ
ncbi:MAG: type II toxin-antitoxin system RelE/ParE family toxin [Acidobacteria bacterium]|nr:type II toxin-antitoxin system RelE/ParE family toxin [Acidobacteriota bacterium]